MVLSMLGMRIPVTKVLLDLVDPFAILGICENLVETKLV